MPNGFQVLKFVMVDFDRNWQRKLLPDAVVAYTSIENNANLTVVFEGATGVMTTYRYKIAVKEIVYVIGQVVHIPARCNAQEPGNIVKCGK